MVLGFPLQKAGFVLRYLLQNQMLTEADTCRKYVVPKLQGAGWDNDPHSIAEQRFFTDGRIIVRGSQATRRPTDGKPPAPAAIPAAPPPAGTTVADIRSLKEVKQPKSDNQMAALVA
jgi:hypothetical protein